MIFSTTKMRKAAQHQFETIFIIFIYTSINVRIDSCSRIDHKPLKLRPPTRKRV